MGKFERKKDAVKEYFEDRDIFRAHKKYEKAVIANSQKIHQLDKKLEEINLQIQEIDNKPKRRNMSMEETSNTFALGSVLPVGAAVAAVTGAFLAPQTAPDLKDTLSTIGSIATLSTPALALATCLTREYRVVGKTFDALKKRSLRKKAERVQEDINSCKIYQIGLTGQEDPIREDLLQYANIKLAQRQKHPDPNFQYLDAEITESDIEEYVTLNF